jgi:hypothetical protein
LRVERLERAQEELQTQARALAETQRALAMQLAENAELSRRCDELKALLADKQSREGERRTHLAVIKQAIQTLEGMS